MIKIELFMAKTCPHCPKVKQTIENVMSHVEPGTVEFEAIDIKTAEGLNRSKAYHITAVPAIVVDGDVLNSKIEEWEIAKLIDTKLHPKKSFWGSLFGR